MVRYYSEEKFNHMPKYKDIDFKLNVADTYSESKIEEAIKKTGQGTNLEPGDLTPRRLQRYFRHCIKEYLVDNRETESYLYRKYSDHDTKFRTIRFPGGEKRE